jgi:hypothetical protein
MSGSPQKRSGASSVLRGVALLARGRAAGFAQFRDTPEAFLTSLTPLIAFPLVGAALSLTSGEGMEAITELFQILCALLIPAVVSHALARLWGREAQWLRFIVAFNWCQWAVPVAAAAALMMLSLLIALGLPGRSIGSAVILGLAAYALWLHWFLARAGLEVSRLRALFLVICMNVGTATVLLLPYLPLILSGQPAREG